MSVQDDTLHRLFRNETPALYRYALRLLKSREEAEDAVQDAYLRIAYPATPYAMPQHPRGWIFRVLRNLCLDRLRSKSARLRVIHDDGDADMLAMDHSDGRTPERDLLATDMLNRAGAAIRAMPDELAEPLILAVIEGLSYRETANVLGISVERVRSRLHRARLDLRETLDGDAPKAQTPPKDSKIVRLKP